MKRQSFHYLTRLVIILTTAAVVADLGHAVERPGQKKKAAGTAAGAPRQPAGNLSIATNRPDLRVTAFAVAQPKYVGTNLIVAFTMVVQNVGNTSTGTHFFNAIYRGGKVVWSGKSDVLLPGGHHRINGSVSLSDPAQQLAGQSFQLMGKADARLIAGDTSVPPWAFVNESNEGNNTFQSVLLTAPQPLGLTSGGTVPAARTVAPLASRASSPKTAAASSKRAVAKSPVAIERVPARAASRAGAAPTRAAEYRPETLWKNREIPTAGNAPLQLLALDELVKDFMRKDGVTGMTVAISRNERLVYSRAFGYANLDKQIEMKHTHRAGIGSVSKIITTLAIMKLTELKDDFSVDRPVYGFDKSLPTPFDPPNPLGLASNGILTDPAYLQAICEGTPNINEARNYAKMQVRHLLSHSSGLYKAKAPTAGLAIREAHLGVLRLNKLAYQPGTGTEYQNHSMGTSGLLVETLSGMGFEAFCRKWILDKVDLPHVVPLGVHKGSRDAAQHKLQDGRYVTVEIKSRRVEDEAGGTSAGGWTATANDLVKLMCATDRSSTRPDVLHRETLATMESIPFPNANRTDVMIGDKIVGDQSPKAHGWGKSAEGKLAHGGDLGGLSSAYMAKFPVSYEGANTAGITVAMVFNCETDNSRIWLSNALAKAVGKAYLPVSLDLF